MIFEAGNCNSEVENPKSDIKSGVATLLSYLLVCGCKDTRKNRASQSEIITIFVFLKMKLLLIIIASVSLTLGVVGIFLPVLPTTPFLLLSASLYARSSDRLYQWLITHRILGNYIRSFREYKAISLKHKVISISTLWLVMLYSIFFVVNEKWYLQMLLGGIALGVSVYILSFKTKK